MNAPISVEAQAYIDKLFPCQKPCDSYGVCEGCCEKTVFLAGYNFGFRAKMQDCPEEFLKVFDENWKDILA